MTLLLTATERVWWRENVTAMLLGRGRLDLEQLELCITDYRERTTPPKPQEPEQ